MSLISALLILFSSFSLESEKASYDILVRGNDVGELKALKEVEGHKTTYRNVSITRANIIKSIEVKLEQEAVYENGVMQFAESKTWVNEKLHRKTTIRRKEGVYFIQQGDEQERQQDKIQYSAIMLMLEEPSGYKRSYSEHEAEYHRLEKIGEHEYRKTAPNGRENLYRYKNGKLVWAKVDAGWYSFEMKLN